MSEFDFIHNDLFDVNSSKKIKGRCYKTSTKKELKLLDRLKSLEEIFPDSIKLNESLHLISSDNFGSIELLKLLNNKYDIKYLCLSTWSYNTDFVQLIKSILNKGCEVVFIVDKSMRTRKAALYAQMVLLLDEYENFKIKIHHMIHSKVTIFKTKEGYFSIEASANYSSNQRIENFTITNDEGLFNFHNKWLNEIIDKEV